MPTSTRIARCRSCSAPIAWAITEKAGKLIPIDANPDGSWTQDPDGPLVRTGLTRSTDSGRQVPEVRSIGGQQTLGLDTHDVAHFRPHHMTCPEGASWKRGSKR